MNFDNYLEETALGPLQRSEAEFLYSMIKVIKPNNIVEFGFLFGASTVCLLEGSLGYDSNVTSFDINLHENMDILKNKYNNFNYCIKDQRNFKITDLVNDKIDFIFLDATHKFECNKITFEKILPYLTDNCIIMVHDTGYWNKKFMLELHFAFTKGKWIDDIHYAHRPEELQFINWVKEEYNFNLIKFGSDNCLRHGFTLLQK